MKSKLYNEAVLLGLASGRGYQRVAENVTQGRADQHEALDFIRELPPAHPLRAAHPARCVCNADDY